MPLAIGCLVAFLLGGLPFALVVVRMLKGIDVRSVGSGNVGATNASRAFASRGGRIAAFVLIYLLDAAKGFLPAFVAWRWIDAPGPIAVSAACGAAAVLGHVFTPFLRFRGGKGVATATGVLFALDWLATLIAVAVFFAVRFATGQVFFGSLALGVALFAGAILLHVDDAFGVRLPITALCGMLAAFLFWTHRSNLKKHFGG